MLGLHCCFGFPSSCQGRGLLCSCPAQASHCGGFSCAEHRPRGPRASALVARRFNSGSSQTPQSELSRCDTQLSCSMVCGIFQDQGLNLHPLHWQADSLPLTHQGSLRLHILRKGLSKNFKILRTMCAVLFHHYRASSVLQSHCLWPNTVLGHCWKKNGYFIKIIIQQYFC